MTDLKACRVNGFIVVRKVGFDNYPEKHALRDTPPRCADMICYSGLDRMAWFDLDEEFYNGTLPDTIKQRRELLAEENDDLTGIRVCKSLPAALALLDFSNHIYPNNDLIVIGSEKLDEIKGTLYCDLSECTRMGYDIVSLGNWSLLRDGLFRSPLSFPNWRDTINRYGLLDSPDSSPDYVSLYEAAFLEGKVEELPKSPYGIDTIEIWKFK